MINRWIVLTILCLGMFGFNYCYDNPVALQDQLQETYHLSNVQYALLYSVYAFPNAIIPFFSGLLTDILGAHIMLIIFFIFILVGHGLFVLGSVLSNCNFMTMIIGRLLFGMGSESYALAVTPPIYSYFKHKELAFALGLTLSFSRIGSSTNDYFTYAIYSKSDSIPLALSVGLFLLLLCFTCVSVLMCCVRKDHKAAVAEAMSAAVIIDAKNASAKETRDEVEAATKTNSENVQNKFRIQDIKTFDSVYWLLVLNCSMLYGAFYPFMNIGSDFLQKTFRVDNETANRLLMIPYVVGSVATMLFGYLSDKIGKKGQLLLFSAFILLLSHGIFIYCILEQIYDIKYAVTSLVGLGLFFSIFCAVIWPSFSLVVDEHIIGTAYGFPTSFYNGTVSVFYIFVGLLMNSSSHKVESYKYLNVEWFLFGTSAFCILSVCALVAVNHRKGNRLSKPTIS